MTVDVLVVSSDLDWMMRISEALRPLSPSTYSALAPALADAREGDPTVLVVAPADLPGLLADPAALGGGRIGAVGVTTRTSVDLLRRALSAGVGDVIDEAHFDTLLPAVEQVAARTFARFRPAGALDGAGVGRVIVVTSAKGGQGATTIATNLAVDLAGRGPTALVEGDPRFGDLIDALGYRQRRTDLVPAGPVTGHPIDRALYRHPAGPLVVLPHPETGDDLEPEDAVAAIDALQRACAFTVIDVPFWVLERYHLHRVADEVLVVSTERARDLVRVPVLVRALGLTPAATHLVVSDQTEAAVPRRREIEAATGLAVIACVPETARAAAALERGEPLGRDRPDDPAAQAIAGLADAIVVGVGDG